MLPHQERVVEEKKVLDEKLEKLFDFISSQKFDELDDAEQGRLTEQSLAMALYSSVLERRISAFA